MFAPHLLPAVLPDHAEGPEKFVSGNRAEASWTRASRHERALLHRLGLVLGLW
jgi:hypothetical protein